MNTWKEIFEGQCYMNTRLLLRAEQSLKLERPEAKIISATVTYSKATLKTTVKIGYEK